MMLVHLCVWVNDNKKSTITKDKDNKCQNFIEDFQGNKLEGLQKITRDLEKETDDDIKQTLNLVIKLTKLIYKNKKKKLFTKGK